MSLQIYPRYFHPNHYKPVPLSQIGHKHRGTLTDKVIGYRLGDTKVITGSLEYIGGSVQTYSRST